MQSSLLKATDFNYVTSYILSLHNVNFIQKYRTEQYVY